MYNKIFTKILDSSIWLSPMPTRIVWVTLLAAMDEDGFCAFASAANIARRAVVPIKEAQAALTTLEGPDPDSSDPDNEGRRIERVDGGWVVLNAVKYREVATREAIREKTKERVRRYRDAKKRSVTLGNADGVTCNASVTQSKQSKANQSKAEQDRVTHAKEAAPEIENRPESLPVPYGSPRVSIFTGVHPKCDPATFAACNRGVCVPAFVAKQWRQQLGNDAHAKVRDFVDAVMAKFPEGQPIGDEPLDFWRGQWKQAHGTTTGRMSKAAEMTAAGRRVVAQLIAEGRAEETNR